MSEASASIEAVNFKQVPGGYVYRAPNRWMFGPVRHYLANEAQKAEIIAILTPRRPVLKQMMLWIALVLMVAAAGTVVWACTGHDDPTAADIFVWVVLVIFEIFAALQILRWRTQSRVQPIIAGLAPSDDRITNPDMQRGLAVAGNACSIKQLAFVSASSVFAFTAFLVCFAFDVALGLHLALLHFAGSIVFGFVSVFWFRRLIRKAELQKASA